MRTIVACAVILALPLAAFASGTGEKPAEAGRTLTLYMLAKSGGEAEIFAIERMDIPAALTLFDWTRFSWDGKNVTTQASSGYGMNRRKVSDSTVGGMTLLEYRVDLTPRQAAGAGAKTSLVVSFTAQDCAANDGSILFQPERMAVTLAVKKNKAASGFVRIVEITHLGDGRFSARVELR